MGDRTCCKQGIRCSPAEWGLLAPYKASCTPLLGLKPLGKHMCKAFCQVRTSPDLRPLFSLVCESSRMAVRERKRGSKAVAMGHPEDGPPNSTPGWNLKIAVLFQWRKTLGRKQTSEIATCLLIRACCWYVWVYKHDCGLKWEDRNMQPGSAWRADRAHLTDQSQFKWLSHNSFSHLLPLWPSNYFVKQKI